MSEQGVRVKLCRECPTVLFMLASDWCGPCKNFKSTKNELLAQNNVLNERFNHKLHYQNYEHGQDDIVQKAFGVQGYPTILVFSPKTSKFVKYSGNRTADDITNFASAYHNGKLQQPVDLWTTVPRLVNM